MQKYGLKIDFFPFIKVEGVSLREFRSQRIELLEHTAILFTSRTTIDHFFRIREEARIAIPETMKYLCNTEAVALYLQKYIVYRKRKIFFADGTFQGYMELILKHRDEKMLLTLSEPYNTEIPSAMERMKLNFNKVVLSRAVARDLSAVNPSAYDMMVFYSPAEITALVNVFGTQNLPRIATFGNSTARAVVDAGIPLSTMAPAPQAPSMTKALSIYMDEVNAGREVAPVVLENGNKVEDFLKAQEAKPSKKNRSKRPAGEKPAGKTASTAKPAVKKAAAKPAAKSSASAKPAVKKAPAKTVPATKK